MDPNSLEAYDFQLPEELIAREAVEPRDASRLLVVDRARGSWEHRTFADLPSYFGAGDLLVANNTRVLRARLLGHRRLDDGNLGGKVEFLLLEEVAPLTWDGMFHGSVRARAGVRIEFSTPDGQGLKGEMLSGTTFTPHGTVRVRFDRDPAASGAGEIPLPPYIDREPTENDSRRYQTVYAKAEGSAAAPTAGLHFTPQIIDALRARGVDWTEVTLHVGLGTFRPVKALDVREHPMHEERYEISEETAGRITAAKAAGRRVTAVGTTTVRTLESAWRDGRIPPGKGRTSIFIRPGAHQFQVVDRLLTNFHLPRSTLLMLVSAFAGRELIMDAYAEAIRERYRFYSYGDAMLLI